MAIEALLFDLGKVLIDFDMDSGIQSMVSCCSMPQDRFKEIIWNEEWAQAYERGEISTGEFHKYLCANAGLTMELDQFCHTWSSIFLPDSIISETLIRSLKRSYPLIVVSNTNAAHSEFFRRNYPILDYFDHLILSHEVGARKPDRKIYEIAMAAAGKPADRLFFTDDLPQNIEAARAMGMVTHRFVSESALIEALRSAGVDVGCDD